MKIERFEDILAWQKAKLLNILVYKAFKDCKDYSFRDQVQRAAVSVMNNIAEGYERKTNKEFKQFLFIAKGSCGEVRSMLDLSLSLGFIEQNDFDTAYGYTEEISRMLSGLIKTL